MNDSKKIITITIIIGIVLSFIAGFIVYNITLNGKSNPNDSSVTTSCLKAGNYTLQYGIYKGNNIEYEWDENTNQMIQVSQNEVVLKLNSDNTFEFEGKKYNFIIKDLNIVTEMNDMIKFEITGNNEINYLVGSGVKLNKKE